MATPRKKQPHVEIMEGDRGDPSRGGHGMGSYDPPTADTLGDAAQEKRRERTGTPAEERSTRRPAAGKRRARSTVARRKVADTD
jgi:hypothetical protein